MKKNRKNTKKRVRTKNKSPMLDLLNVQQNEALNAMQTFLKSGDPFFLLKGYAGTGKTFTIQALIHQLQLENNRLWVAASAPTHKAVKVLKNMANSWKIHNVDFATIYQLLGLKLEYDEEGGRALVEGSSSKIDRYELILLDEASMVSSKLWELLSSVIPSRNVKIICLGDPAQLPPVNEPESPVFTEIPHQAHLTEVMRNRADNPITQIIQSVREQVFNPNHPLILNSNFTLDKSSGVWVLNREKWLHQLVRAFQSAAYKNNPDYVRAIAWTNRAVDYLNDYIRNAIYENAQHPYVIGERLVAKDTIFDPEDGEEIIMPTSSECEVIKAKYGFSDGYNIWNLELVDDEDNKHYLKVIDRSSLKQFNADLKLEAQKAQVKKLAGHKNPWKDYWSLKNRYAQFNYAYAMTSHKGQGSTFTNVFVAQNDICRNPNEVERYKSLYVSYSRASERLLINI